MKASLLQAVRLASSALGIGLALSPAACGSGEVGKAPGVGTAGGNTMPGGSMPSGAATPGGAIAGGTTPGGATPGGATPGGTAPGGGMTPVDTRPAAPPSPTCGGNLPATYTFICSSCHTQNGMANSRYPDLYGFKGTSADFIMRVRSGGTLNGNTMAPYPASIVSDADLQAIFTYFTGSTRATVGSIGLGGVTPLFSASDAVNPPIVFKRDDGVLITRGAGRPRDRHEGPLDTNVPFMEFGPDYFLTRTYGWIVEDLTPLGQSRIRVTYLPLATPQPSTNFRAWKIYGNGDVFSTNGMMNTGVPLPSLMLGGLDLAANYQQKFFTYATTQQQETTINTRTGKPIAPGDLFEFEFGIFIDHGAIQPNGSRTNYYTDTYRYQVGKGGVTSNNPDSYTAGKGIMGPVPAAQQGGDTTNVWPYFMPETQFGQIALNVQHENEQHALMGRRLFHSDFVTGQHSEPMNPVFTEQVGKAGAPNVSTSCESCHINNGPGELLKGPLSLQSSMAIKLVNAGALGNQLELQTGSASVASVTTKSVTLTDGTTVMLSKPKIGITMMNGAMPPAFSARIARKVIGMGLLEAIDEQTILAHADPKNCSGSGVAGRVSFVKDPATGALRVGRFGWKAEKVSIQHQVAEAFHDDMGVGTTLFPMATGGRMPLSDDDLSHLVTYMRLVSVPGQRKHDDPQVLAGETIFKTVGCTNCHVTDVVTGPNHPFVELRNQNIKPYTDLLLHDMGPDLADDSGIPTPDPNNPSAPPGASEWRTPPLWGTGLLGTVSTHTGLLHDGRAANPLEAILWHGGQAEAIKQKVIQLPATDRAALLAFIASL
jgi:CxxC motif-containing protein (DUF1111 family)/cytochrome c553